MKEKINLKSMIAALIILAIGIFLALMDGFAWHSTSSIILNIGCSFIASALVSVATILLVERKKINPTEEWNITKIYSTRAEKNADSDPQLDKARYVVDGIAFGLKSFRTKQQKRTEACLRRGVNFRILTMDPESPFVSQREKEENETAGQIQHTILDLVKWANELNAKGYKGRVVVKGYNCMTLDFYWRVDDELYVGPYWYGYPSQQTITYKFTRDGKGFNTYTEYFETLWDNKDLCRELTDERTSKRGPKKVR